MPSRAEPVCGSCSAGVPTGGEEESTDDEDIAATRLRLPNLSSGDGDGLASQALDGLGLCDPTADGRQASQE